MINNATEKKKMLHINMSLFALMSVVVYYTAVSDQRAGYWFIFPSLKWSISNCHRFVFQRAANMIPAHDSPLAALAFDASGTKLATASEKVGQ